MSLRLFSSIFAFFCPFLSDKDRRKKTKRHPGYASKTLVQEKINFHLFSSYVINLTFFVFFHLFSSFFVFFRLFLSFRFFSSGGDRRKAISGRGPFSGPRGKRLVYPKPTVFGQMTHPPQGTSWACVTTLSTLTIVSSPHPARGGHLSFQIWGPRGRGQLCLKISKYHNLLKQHQKNPTQLQEGYMITTY